jgi:anaerobic magnesium-protoporphyrin IX monomethyl ester cyclase
MKIGCVYTVDTYYEVDKPFSSATEIPFGISIIMTVLQKHGHDVELFVITPETDLENTISKFVLNHNPQLFCYTAVTTQYWQVKNVANHIKNINPEIFNILGGHHASLDSDEVMKEGVFDAICVGEGETAIIELTKNIENYSEHGHIKPIKNLWYYDNDKNKIIKNPQADFRQDLDDLPYINRKLWDKFIDNPSDYPSILLGRGCPFKCTYCSNHAMAKLAEGKYTRFRSPKNIIGEIEYILENYDNVERIYLEVETFGANRKASFAIFDILAEYNSKRSKLINFGANLALTSNFMSSEERCHELLTKAKEANLTTINIGLESGSERMRKEVLIRPKYTNDELVRFCKFAKKYDIKVIFFVLMGLPGETIKDYFETIKTAKRAQPYTCYVSIFYPYLGTDLATESLNLGLVHSRDLVTSDLSKAERSRAILDLDGFSSNRIRLEYILFWFRVYYGHWSITKIIFYMGTSFLRAYPKMYSRALFFRNTLPILSNIVSYLSSNKRTSKFDKRKFDKAVGTRVDVVSD